MHDLHAPTAHYLAALLLRAPLLPLDPLVLPGEEGEGVVPPVKSFPWGPNFRLLLLQHLQEGHPIKTDGGWQAPAVLMVLGLVESQTKDDLWVLAWS